MNTSFYSLVLYNVLILYFTVFEHYSNGNIVFLIPKDCKLLAITCSPILCLREYMMNVIPEMCHVH